MMTDIDSRRDAEANRRSDGSSSRNRTACAADRRRPVRAGIRRDIGGNPPMNRAGHEGFASAFYAGFPDAAITSKRSSPRTIGSRCAFVIHGTHTGNFFGIPATGRPIGVAANVIMHVAGRSGRRSCAGSSTRPDCSGRSAC